MSDVAPSEIPLLDGVGKFAKSIKATGECVRCKFSTHEGSDLVCRRNPPMATVVMANKFGTATPQVMTAFPVIRPDMWCGEFVTCAPVGSSPPFSSYSQLGSAATFQGNPE